MAKRGLYSLALIALAGALAALQPLPLWGDLAAPAYVTQPGRLDSLLAQLQLCPEYLLVLGSDGTGFQVESFAAEYIWLQHDSLGWHSSAPQLPPVCSIRVIGGIAVAAPPAKYAITHTNSYGITSTISPYTAILNECDVLGFSERNGVAVMKCQQRRAFRLNVGTEDVQCTTQGGERQCASNELEQAFRRESFYFCLHGDTLIAIEEISRNK
jgi:hypothetical protein